MFIIPESVSRSHYARIENEKEIYLRAEGDNDQERRKFIKPSATTAKTQLTAKGAFCVLRVVRGETFTPR
jgi:hypothetical protein